MIWTRTDCCLQAVKNYIECTGLATSECCDFSTLRENHRIGDLVAVVSAICAGQARHALLTRAHYWSMLVARRIPIYHIFVMKGSHVYNIVMGGGSVRALDTAANRDEELSAEGLVEELRGAADATAIFILPAWAAGPTAAAALKI